MKKIQISIIILLSVFMTNAQQAIETEKIETYKQRIAENNEKLSEKNLKKDRRRELIEANDKNMDSIIGILESKIKAKGLENKKYKEKLKIKEFLLCSDTTVFFSKFIKLDTVGCPPHIRKYYQLISDLRQANENLSEMEKTMNYIKTHRLTRKQSREEHINTFLSQEGIEKRNEDVRNTIIRIKEE